MHSDVIVIGSGQGGVPLATRLAQQGRQVTVVERAALGGTCVNTGCTPTKTMIASARAAEVARRAGSLGVNVGPVTVDLAAVVERKEAIVARWRKGVERRLLGHEGENGGIRVLRGHGRFVDPRTVEVAGQRLSADLVVINTGARASVPSLPGLDRVSWLDNASLMQLRELPPHLLVLGGGYIGCEMAQMFRRFGAAVTIVGKAPHLLPQEDEDVAAALAQVFRDEGIELRLGADVARVERGPGGSEVALALSDGSRVSGSHLLVATGRRPNTDDLGCAAGGVELDQHGHVVIDDGYRTSAEGVYAIGDVVHGPQFTHTSWDDHRRLLALLAGKPGARGRSGAVIPSTVFTDPQVAAVGLGQREARRRGVAYELGKMPFGDVARAIESGQTAGLLKVLVDPVSEQILGARIVGAEAGELIHVFVALMLARAPARVLVDGQMVHPSFSEGLQSVLMRVPRYS
jgi:pyruvate/2-oxoglutarate dehydrogenase complex dihydrolipoamide dehydrogenase (E3) component